MVVQLRTVRNQNLIILAVFVPTLGPVSDPWTWGLVWRNVMSVSARMLAILVTTTTSSSTFATNMQSRLGTLMSLRLGNKQMHGKCYEWLPNIPNMHVQFHVFFDLCLKVCDLSPKDARSMSKQTIVDPCLSCFVFVNSLVTNIYIYYSVLERGKKQRFEHVSGCHVRVQSEIKHHLP